MDIPPIENTSLVYHRAYILWKGDGHVIAPDIHDKK